MKKTNFLEGLPILEPREGTFCTQKGLSEGVDDSRREGKGDPLQGGPKLGTCAANAKGGF